MPVSYYDSPFFLYNFGYIPSAEKQSFSAPDFNASRQPSAKRQNRDMLGPIAKKPKAMSSLDDRCINTIRVLACDMVERAKSGHPGAAMGCAPMAHALWGCIMNYNPDDPSWCNRDRFVLSNGHACTLLYSALHLTGYDVTMDDLKQFRKIGSRTPGHPELGETAGVEVTTGPLGQGISNGVGLAMASAHAAATFNKDGFRLFDSCTYVICGDGCLQEGVSCEASSLAGHLGLGNLIVLYDDNNITIDGSTDLSFTEDVLKRYESYGWHTVHVQDGDTDLHGIVAAIEEAKAVTDKPSMIKVTTTIGKGSAKEATAAVHGAPLGSDDLASVKRKYGFDPEETFVVPPEVAAFFGQRKSMGQAAYKAWQEMFGRYKEAYPELGAELARRLEGRLPEGWKAALPTWTPKDKALATRQSSSQVLGALCQNIPEMVGGSADLSPSCLTKFSGAVDFQKTSPEGRYIRFGVREHAMAAMCNGIQAFGLGFVPFCATFLNFTGYALGAVRLSALSHLGVIYVMTHDSIGLGEDGPTHQPVEMLASLRAMPNIFVIRPADANEVVGAYTVAVERRSTPSVLALSRQGCPNLEGSSAEAVAKGGYILRQASSPKLVLVASGSEVQLIVQVADALKQKGVEVQVVSLPCWELFDAQPIEYRRATFPSGVPVLAVEAASDFGWNKYAHATQGMQTFGASGPMKDVSKKFGFTVDAVVEKAHKLMDFYSKPGQSVPSLVDLPTNL